MFLSRLIFALPVTLTDFKAITDNKNVDLTWKTEFEGNNKGFEIQRSNDNSNWYTIGFVNGRGQSSTTQNYTFTDNQLAPGKYFYRLNQVDIDNHARASSIVTATLSGRGKLLLFQNMPNPVRAGLTTLIRYDLPDAQKARLSVLDITGREVKVLSDMKGQAGSHLVSFETAGLAKQLYIIRLQTETEVITKKMLIE